MRKKILLAIILALLLTGAGVLAFWGVRHHLATFTYLDGVRYRRDTSYLDLSGGPVEQPEKLKNFYHLKKLNLRKTGLTPEEYDMLRELLPDCEIQWSLYFQGSYYNDTTTSITLQSLTDEDVALLDYLPELRIINATDCDDLPQLFALQQRRPDCQVYYNVSLAGTQWSNDAKALVLPGADPDQIRQQLKYLPHVESILLTEPLAPAEALLSLQTDFPGIHIAWQVDICGVTADPSVTELDLSGIPMDSTSAVEQALRYLPNLQKVIMCDCGISNEEMDALNQKYENIQFVWTVKIGPYIRLRTDTTAFIPIKQGIWLSDRDCENLRYCTEMVCLDLGHHNITKCDFVAYMPHLKYLVLADTQISDISPLADRKELLFLELFMTDVTDYTPLLTLTALEDLNLGYTWGQADVIAQMPWLKRLWWSPYSGWKQNSLAQSLPNTQVETRYGSSTGGQWRKGKHYYDMRDMLGMYYMTG